MAKGNNIPVFSGKMANSLLNAGKGYQIISVAPNRTNRVSTVYYFYPTEGIMDDIRNFALKEKELRGNTSAQEC